MRSAGAAHKNMEAPQSIDSGDARKRHLVTSHQSLVTSHSRLLIPSYSSPLSNFRVNPLLILFPQCSDHISSSLPRSHQHLADEDGVGAGLSHLFHDRL